MQKKHLLLLSCMLSTSILFSGCASLKFEDKNHPEYSINGTKELKTQKEADNSKTETNSSKKNKDNKHKATNAPTATPIPDVTITVSAAGDCTLGSDPKSNVSANFDSVYHANQDDPSYFFKNVLPIFSEDDMTLVNFEGTLTTSTQKVAKSFNFKGDPSYVNILKEGSVEAVSLANNHVHDYSEEGFNDTKENLGKSDILFASGDTTAIYTAKDKKIGMVAVDGLQGVENAERLITTGIEQLRKKNADIILVSIHCGTEHTSIINTNQKTLAHYAVDQGADLVLGHHPHDLQGIEKYKGIYIIYSLANFCFGGNTNPVDKDTMIVQKKFTFHNGTLKKNNGITVIPCSVSSVPYKNNYQPTPAEGTEKDRIMQKISSYCKEFNLQVTADGKIKTLNME